MGKRDLYVENSMLARKPNSRGSEFIREEAGTFAAFLRPEIPSSRIKWSATPVGPTVHHELKISANLWERGLPANQSPR
ncbi:hypothetical protein AO242_14500 [Pseudomonas sp. ICMP 561]|nr:hypothetical protein AO242_14500 [Pseudomonas sp. ICMP 561]